MISWARPDLLHQRGRFWYYKLAGERTFHSTGKEDRAHAEKFAIERYQETRRTQKAEDLLADAPPVKTYGSVQEWARRAWDAMEPREHLAVLYTCHQARCHYCGGGVHLDKWRDRKSPQRATIDHKIPLVGGGPDSFDNSVLACQKCNSSKGSTDYRRFVASILREVRPRV